MGLLKERLTALLWVGIWASMLVQKTAAQLAQLLASRLVDPMDKGWVEGISAETLEVE